MERGTETIPVIGKNVVQSAKHLEEQYLGHWQFYVPESAEEIMAEGRAMYNALSIPYFSQQVANGEMVLVFLKYDGKPYADIAIHENTVFHAVGARNYPVQEAGFEIIRKWATDKGLKLAKEDAVGLSKETSRSIVGFY